MRKLEYLEVTTVMEAHPTACIDDCLREAMILCLEQQQDVTFAHNQYTYHVVFRNVLRCYKREEEPKPSAVDESLPRVVRGSELRSGDVFVPMPIAPLHVVIKSEATHRQDGSVVSRDIDYQGVDRADDIEGTIIVDHSSSDPELLLLEREKGA